MGEFMAEDKSEKKASIFAKIFKKKGDKDKTDVKDKNGKDASPAKKAINKDCPCNRKPPNTNGNK